MTKLWGIKISGSPPPPPFKPRPHIPRSPSSPTPPYGPPTSNMTPAPLLWSGSAPPLCGIVSRRPIRRSGSGKTFPFHGDSSPDPPKGPVGSARTAPTQPPSFGFFPRVERSAGSMKYYH